MRSRTTAEVIDRFNQVFADHDAGPLTELVGENCVMEAIQPAPDGTRTVGREACLEFWRALAGDRGSRFEPEQVTVGGEHATIRWRLRFGDDPADSIRGVTLLRVVDGKIVEALAYSKTGGVPLAAETGNGERSTLEVLDRYNDAFRLHDPELLIDLIADDCVIEDSGPAPAGERREGGAACLARWSELAANRDLRFTPETAESSGELAVQPWLLQWGDGPSDRLRGVNLIRVRGGKIIEARGYVKS